MSENGIMRGNEFIKKIQKLAKKRGISATVNSSRGKGSSFVNFRKENRSTNDLIEDHLRPHKIIYKNRAIALE